MSNIDQNVKTVVTLVKERTGFEFQFWRFEHDNPDRVVLAFTDSRFQESLPCELAVDAGPFDQSWLLKQGYVEHVAKEISLDLMKLYIDLIADIVASKLFD